MITKETYNPSYIWPNPAFPFRVYFESSKCRVFIIENIRNNWEWLKEWHEKFRKTDFFFIYSGWYFSEGTAADADVIFNILNLDRSNFYILFNSELEKNNFSKYNFRGSVINQNAWLDENLVMKPLKTKKNYDAIYVARRSAFKRHCLASKVSNLALVAGINHGNTIAPVPPHTYINEKLLSAEEVCYKVNQSRCGLILSETEGACFASSEYLLCGIPVVSTHSLGGRDEWYNEYNSIVVDANEDAVQAAVIEFNRKPRNPEKIRNMHVQQAAIYRKDFIDVFENFLKSADENSIDPSRYFWESFYHKLRRSYRPDFRSIFGS